MTEETKLAELKPTDNFNPTQAWPDPTPEMLETILFDTIWRVIKSWDVNVPSAYSGYMGATGNHARAIYDAVAPLLSALRHPAPDGVAGVAGKAFDALTIIRNCADEDMVRKVAGDAADMIAAILAIREQDND